MVGQITTLCCFCFIDCFQVLEPYSRNIYMAVALNARPCFMSAYHAQEIVASRAATFRILDGATWLFQAAGLGAITSLGHVQMFLVVHCTSIFKNPMSAYYLPNPGFLILCGTVICAVVAFPFMVLFDTVSDTILFCKIVDDQRKWKQPPSLIERACGGPFTSFFGDVMSSHCASRPQGQSTTDDGGPQPVHAHETAKANASPKAGHVLSESDDGL